MCGIFGIVIHRDSQVKSRVVERVLKDLFRLSESRGTEASGIAVLSDTSISVLKHSLPAARLIGSVEYQNFLRHHLLEPLDATGTRGHVALAAIGHCRLVTNGSQECHYNNQPVISSGMVCIHNGIVANVDDLWRRFEDLKRMFDVDTEIALKLILRFREETGSLVTAIRKTYGEIEGAASVAVLFEDLDVLLLSTNNGSLFVCQDTNSKAWVFASEKEILRTVIRRNRRGTTFREEDVRQIKAGTGLLLDLKTLKPEPFSLGGTEAGVEPGTHRCRERRIIGDVSDHAGPVARPDPAGRSGPEVFLPKIVDEFPQNRAAVAKLTRCTRCVLPETMPFITFDAEGVCNYCRNYKQLERRGPAKLEDYVERHRRRDGEPDCLVAFSGGRDSSYGLHYIKTVLHMNPVAFTYDWGMVTDLARRNQMRMCGKLGVEHILVSANIARKRSNIRKNVLAWLKRPHLGAVPLFMAGDKQFFYHANRLRAKMDIPLVFFCVNLLEATSFKSGFCGVRTVNVAYNMTVWNRVRLAMFYAKEALANPAYLNTSVLDSLFAYGAYYVFPHDFPNIYDFVGWNEPEVEHTLLKDYHWETAPDTPTTWRIGDGTAPFYNYIYYTMAGLTENDTFRSNQVREGMLSREAAVRLVEKENEPRYDAIRWYCDIVGVDFERTIVVINAAPKLYRV